MMQHASRSMILDHRAIASLIPHQGSMCLLDTVERWDEREIVCTTRQHVLATNPLRDRGRLSSLHGIELAAQAAAVHAGLLAPAQTRPRAGLLLSVRQCVFHRPRLDDIEGALTVEAERLAGSDQALSYRFALHGSGALLVEGRLNVMLQNDAL
jgi:predicted hotdog family 3-hydroxylacyl-ACP dehydratase